LAYYCVKLICCVPFIQIDSSFMQERHNDKLL